MAWVSYQKRNTEVVTKALFTKVKKNLKKWLLLGQTNLKEQFGIYEKPPVDTGYTRDSSRVFELTDKLGLRFFTPNDKESNDGKLRGYAVFPLLGLSTSKKYGMRNWLKDSATKTLKEILK